VQVTPYLRSVHRSEVWLLCGILFACSSSSTDTTLRDDDQITTLSMSTCSLSNSDAFTECTFSFHLVLLNYQKHEAFPASALAPNGWRQRCRTPRLSSRGDVNNEQYANSEPTLPGSVQHLFPGPPRYHQRIPSKIIRSRFDCHLRSGQIVRRIAITQILTYLCSSQPSFSAFHQNQLEFIPTKLVRWLSAFPPQASSKSM
jgi:hypothetical protein